MNVIEYLWNVGLDLFKVAQVLFDQVQGMNPIFLLAGPGVGVLIARIIIAFKSVGA